MARAAMGIAWCAVLQAVLHGTAMAQAVTVTPANSPFIDDGIARSAASGDLITVPSGGDYAARNGTALRVDGTGTVLNVTGGTATLNGGVTVNAPGEQGTGLRANGPTARITSSANIEAGQTGIAIANGGQVSLATGASVRTTGAQAPALLVTEGTAGLTASGSTINSNGVLLAVSGNGTVANLTATNGSMLSGSITAGTGAAANLSLQSGSIWTLGPNDSTLNTLTLDTGTLRYSAATSLTVASPITLNAGGGTIDTHGVNATLGTPITGTGGLTKAGAGVLTVANNIAHAYGGPTTLADGVLAVFHAIGLGALGNPIIFDGGTLRVLTGFFIGRPVTIRNGNGTWDVAGNFSTDFRGNASGEGGLTKTGMGTLILSNTNTYSGGTTISEGTLQIGNAGTSGSVTGAITNNSHLVFNRSDTLVVNSAISGTGHVTQAGSGTTVLAGTNSYSGGTSITAGTLQIGNNNFPGSITGDILNNGTLAFARTNFITFGGVISGSGQLRKESVGTLILTGQNTYTGETLVEAGTLRLSGTIASTRTTVRSGATLEGSGSIGGDVAIDGGGILAPGTSPGTLSIHGALTLAPGSVLNYEFGQAGTAGGPLNDLTLVGGNLTLDGTLNLSTSSAGRFDSGIYRIFDYGGTLTDNTLEVGAAPSPTLPSDLYVQTSVARQVNLVNTTGLTLNFWDGAAGPKNSRTIDGGSGIWQGSGGNDNWTGADGALNAPFRPGTFAVLAGPGGRIDMDASRGAVTVSGLQFASDGYRLSGGSLTLVGGDATTLRVGDGSTLGAGYTATIETALAGATRLVKTDLGTLILHGTNTYSAGTTILGGVLEITRDANLGDAAGTLHLDGGTLRTTADMGTARATTLAAGGGSFETLAGTRLNHDGIVDGMGTLRKTGTGTLALGGANSHTGGTLLDAGTLRVGNDRALGTGTLVMAEGSTLGFDGSHRLSNALTLSGDPVIEVDTGLTGTLGGLLSDGTAPGVLEKTGAGTLVLTADNRYTGGTLIALGTLQLGEGADTGSIVGNVVNHGMLAFHRSGTLRLDGVISGTGTVAQRGSGTTVLAGLNTYSGPTLIDAGRLQAGAAGALSAASPHTVAAGATLDTGGMDQTLASLTNHGTLSLPGAAASTVSTATVLGDYAGNQGLVRMGTTLGSSGSLTDRLRIGGQARGSTRVDIVNLDGLGGQTSGNGILLIDTARPSDPGAFSLNGLLVAGAFEYRMNAAPNGTGLGWFLSSQADIPPLPPIPPVPPVPPAPPDPPVPPSPPPTPPDPPAPPVPPAPRPGTLYRPEAVLAAAVPAQLRQMNQSMLGKLHQRIGDDAPRAGQMALADHQNPEGRRVWGRLIGADFDLQQQGSTSPSSQGHLDGFQTGIDLLAQPAAGWRAGLYAGQLDGDAHISGFARGMQGSVGTSTLRSQYLGAYATYRTEGGFHADGVLQLARHSYTLQPRLGWGRETTGHGHSTQASIEIGRSWALTPHWHIEPQAQLAYQDLRLDDLDLPGARVRQHPASGWLARAGLRIRGTLDTRLGTLQPYAGIHLYHASSGIDHADFIGPAGSARIDTATGHDASELNAGFTLGIASDFDIYGELGKVFSHGGRQAVQVRSSLQGSVGLRWRW